MSKIRSLFSFGKLSDLLLFSQIWYMIGANLYHPILPSLFLTYVKRYCETGKITGAFLSGKKWNIPEDAERVQRINRKSHEPKDLKTLLRYEKENGSKLTLDETRYIFETNTIGLTGNGTFNVNDIVETINHFCCVDMIIEQVNHPVSESFLKKLHLTLKNGTDDSRKDWFAVGEYKKLPNEVGVIETSAPDEVSQKMKELLKNYNTKKEKTLDDILAFHCAFETIHLFQDGNGRVGRLIMFKECLRNTCLSAQDQFKKILDYFRIPYED